MTELLKKIGIAEPTGTGWLTVVFAFLVALFFTWRFLPHVRRFALKVGWADMPNERRLNREPLPNAGGLAVYAGVVLALVVAAFLRPILVEHVLIQVLAILLGGAWLVLVGFIDDQFGLPPLFRLFVQTLAALLLMAVGVRFEAAFGTPLDPVLGFFLTWLWVVGITNALNLMDGLDGLAGGVAYISAMSLLFVSAQFPYWAAGTLVLAALAGAALGFLRHNLHPSRIILGDAGAYFLGFTLAATSLLGNLKLTTFLGLLPPALFLLLPILDTTQVVVRRLLRGQNPLSTPGKDHIHHRLLARGLSQRRVAFLLWGLALLFNLLAMAYLGMPKEAILASFFATVSGLGWVTYRRLRALWRGAE
ncbi:MraY family glycosyltransferase [Thermus caldilimi]|uniref:MraY family glycosyltransferase n=1 Tax=Thermus caldilimi TaxID=2483360 RepID=UPI00107668FE|nr:MraY family glycosyltransferase [Thermus caldilimi]